MELSFEGVSAATSPFPYFKVPAILRREDADACLDWLRNEAPWLLRVEDFYVQHEFSLRTTDLGPAIAPLAADETVEAVANALRERFDVQRPLRLVDVNAHRLTPGQVIRIHNDYIEAAETHRLLIQLNAGWRAEQGGLLMLFSDEDPSSVTNVILPVHGSGFAFEISPQSFHAVSTIRDGERFTIVYTFA